MPDKKSLQKLSYPKANEGKQVDNYHGTKVPDPYRGLERWSKGTESWLEAQKKLTRKILAAITERPVIKDYVTKLRNHATPGASFKIDGKHYWWLCAAGQNYSVLYTGDMPFATNARVVFDPNKLSDDGSTKMIWHKLSPNNRYFLFCTSEFGTDDEEVRVFDLRREKILADKHGAAEVRWCSKSNGYYYSRLDVEDDSGKLPASCNIYYHQLGTDTRHDVCVYKQVDVPGRKLRAGAEVDTGSYLLVVVHDQETEHSSFLVKDLKQEGSTFVELLADGGKDCSFVKANGKSRFWIATRLDAPNGRLIEINAHQPGKIKEILPECNEILQSVTTTSAAIVASYLKDAQSTLKEFTRQGKFVREIPLPAMGYVDELESEKRKREITFDLESYIATPATYSYNLDSGETTLKQKIDVMYEPDEYTSEQVFYTSKDGTRIPMFISYKKGLELDGNNPAYLYGYGGFAVPIVPEFSFFTLTLMKLGFVVAFANLRGGGEYGEAWHELGMKANKQNVFDDFIASAEWLIANGYTNAGRLSINGVSNGGLLVAAAITQRPDLFKAAIVEVGVLDMLRFSKLEGSIWEPEYGSPDKEEDFQVLYAYSPQHRLQNGVEYPATMVMTGRYDDRVLPAHSCKFTAALQKAQGGDRPILLRVDDKSGHSGAHTEADIIEAITDRVAFLVEMLEVDISPLEK